MWQSNDGAGTSLSIADMVKEAANSFIETELLPGFVYSEEHGLYHNAQTGYYYDMQTQFYYHESTGWVQYDPLTGKYNPLEKSGPKAKWKNKKFKRSAEKIFGSDYVDSMDDQNIVDSCEVLFDLVDRVTFLSGESLPRTFAHSNRVFDDELGDYVRTDRPSSHRSESPPDSRYAEHLRRKAEEESSVFPPCIRLINVTDGNKLYVVTIDGVKIGWGSKCEVCLPLTDALADEHVKITFIEGEDRHYQIECLRKRYPAYLDGRKITTKTPQILEHGTQLVIGAYTFQVHIHKGYNTCPDCEPGILNARLEADAYHRQRPSYTERRMNHKAEMKSLKEKFGVEVAEEPDKSSYHDRAAKRRKYQGSEPNIPKSGDMYSDCKATPVPGASTSSVQLASQPKVSASISSENKGFKLLQKMGWSENTGLGKAQQGITAPIGTLWKNDKRGLGLSSSNQQQRPQITISLKDKKRQEIQEKTRQRFDQARSGDE